MLQEHVGPKKMEETWNSHFLNSNRDINYFLSLYNKTMIEIYFLLENYI